MYKFAKYWLVLVSVISIIIFGNISFAEEEEEEEGLGDVNVMNTGDGDQGPPDVKAQDSGKPTFYEWSDCLGDTQAGYYQMWDPRNGGSMRDVYIGPVSGDVKSQSYIPVLSPDSCAYQEILKGKTGPYNNEKGLYFIGDRSKFVEQGPLLRNYTK